MSLPLRLEGHPFYTGSGAKSLNMGDLRTPTVDYQGKIFTSASDALQAYIEDFEGKSPKVKYERQVNNLLLPPTVLSQTVNRSLETGIRHTRDEKRLYDMKRMVDESFEKIVKEEEKIRQVKEALTQSAKVIHEVSADRHSSDSTSSEVDMSNIPSDLDSLSTDMLVSIPPLTSSRHIRHKTHKKHVYSYRTNYQKNDDPRVLTLQDLGHNRIDQGSIGHTIQRTDNKESRQGHSRQNFEGERSGSRDGVRNRKPVVSHKYHTTSPDPSPESIDTKGKHPLPYDSHDRSQTIPLNNFKEQYYQHKKSARHETHRGHVHESAYQEPTQQARASLRPKSDHPKTKGGRPPPSWITDVPEFPVNADFKVGRSFPPPGGRPPPSWITDVPDHTEITVTGYRRKLRLLRKSKEDEIYPTSGKRPSKLPAEYELPGSPPGVGPLGFRSPNFSEGGRPPPSWITEVPEHPFISEGPSVTARQADDDSEERSPLAGGRPPPSWITNVTDTQSYLASNGNNIGKIKDMDKNRVRETAKDSFSFSDLEEGGSLPEDRLPSSLNPDVPDKDRHTLATRSSSKPTSTDYKPPEAFKPPPSWITDVSDPPAPVPTKGGRSAPSWITDVSEPTRAPAPAQGGRPAPSWITDVPETEQMQHPNAWHPPPSWITEVPTILYDLSPQQSAQTLQDKEVKSSSRWLTDDTSEDTAVPSKEEDGLMSSYGTIQLRGREGMATESTQVSRYTSIGQGNHTAEVSLKGKPPPSWIGELEYPGRSLQANQHKGKGAGEQPTTGYKKKYTQRELNKDYDFPSEKYLTDWSKYTQGSSSTSAGVPSSVTLPTTHSFSSTTTQGGNAYTFGRQWSSGHPMPQQQTYKRRYPNSASSDGSDSSTGVYRVSKATAPLDVLEKQGASRSQSSSSSGRKENSPGGPGEVKQGCYVDSPQTDVVLEGDRSWERLPVPFKAPKYVEERTGSEGQTSVKRGRIMDKFLQDCLNDEQTSTSPRLTGQNTPGSMEALKTILFKMQSMATTPEDVEEEVEEHCDKENSSSLMSHGPPLSTAVYSTGFR
ncbi:uncharacterized protein LOC106177472 isoform X2 [Lingula anatina]|uniref:Uncharacterized protein LOC106177472 isoform X2 n=1 Tax=Lingula anatina TaxID=7574 RepID=A0A1S3JZ72_LINAN|nr:uncharacterized protein LOC106177472 isoform X2 [Lingula anatina]|eukprot:XP_013415705.1 uncharacterized protein LOC106177472 isoform X2 [Lingula anatina]